MIPGLLFLVYALAVARVTRLIAADRITEAPREWLAARLWRLAYWRTNAGYLRGQFPGWADDPVQLRAQSDYRADLARDNGADMSLPVYLLTCRWCASVYVAAVAAPIAYWWGAEPWFLVPALALAFSHVTGLLAKGE